MVDRVRSDVSDGVSWKCPQCKGRKSIREGSFFDKSKLTLQKWLLLIYRWVCQYPVTDAAEEAEVREATACDVYQWLREVCFTTLTTTPIILGGNGVKVQIDKSQFRHKPKVDEIDLSAKNTDHVYILSIYDSTIVEGHQHSRYGCLAW